MKKRFAALFCAMVLILCGAAFAWEPSASDAMSEGIQLTLNGNVINLSFDSSDKYSSIVDGNVQASFYAYFGDPEKLYELYMIFPEAVQPGVTVDPAYAMQHAPDCSVVMIVTAGQTESYYFAGQVDGKPYPDSSAYAISFQAVESNETGSAFAGTLSATLVGVEMDSGNVLERVEIVDAPFSFTMPAANRLELGDDPIAHEQTVAPDFFSADPAATPAPTVAPTPVQTWKV